MSQTPRNQGGFHILRSRFQLLLVYLTLCALVIGCAHRAEYPNRPITLLCPWAAGGGTDRISRQMAVQLEKELGVPVNVVNATGGGGVTGHTRGALARPDGYTITMTTCELNMLHWRGLTNITNRDYRPIMLLNGDDAALFVATDAPWATREELEQAIRADPGALRASGTAFGGMWHVSLAGWLNAIGLSPADVIWISINGAAPSLQELMAGGVDLVCCSVPEAQTLLDARRVRCLAVMGEERLPTLPDVPTLKEQSVDWTSRGWRALAVPNRVPEDRFNTLVQAAQRVVSSQEYLEFMENSGFRVLSESPEEFQRYLIREDEQYGAIFNSEAFQGVHRLRFGPMLFPTLIGATMALTAAALLLTGGLRVPTDNRAVPTQAVVDAACAIALVMLYILLAEHLGFVITAALLLWLMLSRLKVTWPVATAITVVLVPVLYQLFAVYLRVPLPWGWLGW